jgi:hypothetical protein
MSRLPRKLPGELVNALNDLANADGLNWWKATLAHPEVRLAIRDGYLNAYVDGQSIFWIGWDSGSAQPYARVHYKYLLRPALIEDRGDGEPNRLDDYIRFDGKCFKINHLSNLFQDIFDRETINDLVNVAKRFAGAEKCAVDEIARRDASLIDLEIALPGQNARVDIATVHPKGEDEAQVTFYEVKRRANKELSSSSIFKQMDKYDRFFLQTEGHTAEDYARTARTLHSLVGASGNRKFDQAFLDVVSGKRSLSIDPQVRLLVTEYDDDQRIGEVFQTLMRRLVERLGNRVYARGSFADPSFTSLSKLRPWQPVKGSDPVVPRP